MNGVPMIPSESRTGEDGNELGGAAAVAAARTGQAPTPPPPADTSQMGAQIAGSPDPVAPWDPGAPPQPEQSTYGLPEGVLDDPAPTEPVAPVDPGAPQDEVVHVGDAWGIMDQQPSAPLEPHTDLTDVIAFQAGVPSQKQQLRDQALQAPDNSNVQQFHNENGDVVRETQELPDGTVRVIEWGDEGHVTLDEGTGEPTKHYFNNGAYEQEFTDESTGLEITRTENPATGDWTSTTQDAVAGTETTWSYDAGEGQLTYTYGNDTRVTAVQYPPDEATLYEPERQRQRDDYLLRTGNNFAPSDGPLDFEGQMAAEMEMFRARERQYLRDQGYDVTIPENSTVQEPLARITKDGVSVVVPQPSTPDDIGAKPAAPEPYIPLSRPQPPAGTTITQQRADGTFMRYFEMDGVPEGYRAGRAEPSPYGKLFDELRIDPGSDGMTLAPKAREGSFTTFSQEFTELDSGPGKGSIGRGLTVGYYEMDDVRIVGARPIEFSQQTVDGHDVLGVKYEYEYEYRTTNVTAVKLSDAGMAPLYVPKVGGWKSATPQELDQKGIMYPTPKPR